MQKFPQQHDLPIRLFATYSCGISLASRRGWVSSASVPTMRPSCFVLVLFLFSRATELSDYECRRASQSRRATEFAAAGGGRGEGGGGQRAGRAAAGRRLSWRWGWAGAQAGAL